jgi:D-lyxose ketol-isomerase
MPRAEEPTGAGLRPVKRSFIDSRIDRMLDLCGRHGVALPPFALWRDADFRANPNAARLIAERGMGWNVVEFKPGLFAREGLTLFTLRMGDWRELGAGRGRLYAEKAILAEDGQRAPHHYHAVKTEDIVNRGGARLVVELFRVDARGAPLKERFRALKDVSVLDLNPGDRVRLEPGESLTLEPFVAHAFWAEGGAALAGEVSLANDDATDNYFLPPLEPFAPIEEDAPARYVTVRDHERR